MAKVPPPRIPLAPIVAAAEAIREKPPPTVDLDRALQIIGPDMRRMLKQGWGDEDMIAALIEVNEAQSMAAGEPSPPLTREILTALLAQREKKEKKASRKRRARNRSKGRPAPDATAIATRSPTEEPRPELPAPPTGPLLLSGNRPDGAQPLRQLAPRPKAVLQIEIQASISRLVRRSTADRTRAGPSTNLNKEFIIMSRTQKTVADGSAAGPPSPHHSGTTAVGSFLPADAGVSQIGVGEGFPEIVSRGRRRLKFVAGTDEAGDRALRFAGQLYQGLVRTGWLEEEEYGLKVMVDMPMGALLVVQKLATLKSDVSQRFGGLVVHIKASLDLIDALPSENTDKHRSAAAHGLREARKRAEDFVRTLRAILSDLRRVRKALFEAQDLRSKMDTYFEQFIGELLLKDFQSILTFNHPYRYRDAILAAARRIATDPPRLRALVDGYVENGFTTDPDRARSEATDDLIAIEDTFETVGTMFERISHFRRALETRLRNTVKYAEQGERGLGTRARELVRRMEQLLAAPRESDRYAGPTVPVMVEPVRTPWSERVLASIRQARAPLASAPLMGRPTDPLYLFKKKLRAEYLDRIIPSPQQIRRYLDATIPPFHTREARFVAIADVDGFLAFDALRRYALTREVPALIKTDYVIEPLPGSVPHDSEWLTCGNFVIRRLGGVPC